MSKSYTQYSHDDVKIHGKSLAYDGFFQLYHYELQFKCFAGEWSPKILRECFERGRSAAVLPFDPHRDEVVLTEQIRVGCLQGEKSPWLIELVAGMVEPGESPLEVIHRESKEEINANLLAVEPIFEYWVSPGGSSERISLYCGRVDAEHLEGIYGNQHEAEDIRVRRFSCSEAFKMVNDGHIDNAATIISLQWLQLNLDKLKQSWV